MKENIAQLHQELDTELKSFFEDFLLTHPEMDSIKFFEHNTNYQLGNTIIILKSSIYNTQLTPNA